MGRFKPVLGIETDRNRSGTACGQLESGAESASYDSGVVSFRNGSGNVFCGLRTVREHAFL